MRCSEVTAKGAPPESNQEETSDRSAARSINQNSWPGIFRPGKILRMKGRPGNGSGVRDDRGGWSARRVVATTTGKACSGLKT